MPTIAIYSKTTCGFCRRAKTLLEEKGLDFDEILIDKERGMRERMIEETGRHTVPQIFIAGRHVGGHDELMALESAGRLDQLIKEVSR